MDSSITKILQAVQEEFPPARSNSSGKPRRQSSTASSNTGSSRMDIPIMDDNSLPTSSELYTSSSTFTSALSMSPPQEEQASHIHTSAPSTNNIANPTDGIDGQNTPRAGRTASLNSNMEDASGSSQFLSERQEVSTTSTLPPRIDTQVQNKQSSSSSSTSSRSPRLNSAPTFISMPSSSNSNTSAGFKPSSMLHKNDGLMLTPGGDDIPFQFKKRPNMQERRPSHEIFA